MKAMKKVFAILLTVAMVMSLSVSAFAANTAVAVDADGTTYTDVNEAVKTGGTITLLANVSDVTVPENTIVTIDLNGYTISSVKDHAITNNGTLTVTGTGTVDGGSTSGKGALYNAPGATATLNGGTFTGSKWYVIKNLGTMTISGASVVQNEITSSAIANGYWGSGSANDCYVPYPTDTSTTVSLTITGGSVTGGINCVKNDDYGTLSISGGYFYTNAEDGAVIMNWNKATISGGTFVGDGTAAVISNGYWTANAGVGDLTISGGDFTATNNGNLFGTGANESGATTTITGGTFVGTANNVSVVSTTVSGTTAVFSDDSLPDEWITTGYEAPETATIIVHGVAGQTYTAYKIFDVTRSGENYAYSISADSAWLPVVLNYMGYTQVEGKWYATSDTTTTEGTTTVNEGATEVSGTFTSDGWVLALSSDTTKYVVTSTLESNSDEVAEFSQYLLKNVPDGVTGTEATANSDGTATISSLQPGYYLVDSSLGALMILDTADVATVNEKNTVPTLAKKVYEDSTNKWESTANADFSQLVYYTLYVNTGSDSTALDDDFVITDTLPAGFTPYADESTNSVYAVNVSTTADNDQWVSGTDYTVAYDSEENTMTFTLKEAKLEEVGTSKEIQIFYVLTVGQDAVVGAAGNTNTAYLTYHGYNTVEVQATVYTYKIGADADGNYTVTKVDGNSYNQETKTYDTPLAGVEFVLSKTDVDDYNQSHTYYAVLTEVKEQLNVDGEDVVVGYNLSGWTTTEADATPIVTDEYGHFVVYGLDAHEYTLTETKTVDGYNLLDETIIVTIDEEGNVTYKMENSTSPATESIYIVNNSGSELPSTGGIGTTIFYVVGSVLVLGAAILLITKKRMNNVQ